MKFTWQDIDRISIERDCRHIANAGSDARKDYPDTNASGRILSINEQEFVDKAKDEIERQIVKATAVFDEEEKNLIALKEKIRNDSFNEIHPELKSDYNSYILSFKQKLTQAYNNWAVAKKDYDSFQNDNGLTRPYTKKSILMILFSFILVAGLLLFEIDYNSNALSSASMEGARGARSIAYGVAFINVFLSFLVGMGVMRHINHIKKSIKITFSIILGAYVLMFIYINTMLGIFRTVAKNEIFAAGMQGTEPSDEQMRDWAIRAFQLDLGSLDITGVILIIIGCSFATISLFDGYFIQDTYPGYGKVGSKLTKEENTYLKIKSEYEKQGKDRYEMAIKSIDERKELDSGNRILWSEIINSFQASFEDYQRMVTRWENDIRHIINEYREENTKIRKSPPPKYFENNFSLDDKDKSAKSTFSAQAACFMTDEDRSNQLASFVDLNQNHFKNSMDEISETYRKYGKEMEGIINDYPIY